MRRIVPVLAALVLTLATGAAFAGKSPKAAPALHGYCPVCYLDMGRAVKGDPKFSVVHEGRRYVFANAEAKKMFESSRAKYQVACDGSCATAASMGKTMKADPTLFSVHEGRLYLFSSPEAKKMFDASPAEMAKQADSRWAEQAKK